MAQVVQDVPEQLQFVIQKGVMNIYRFEDVVFGVYPQLGVQLHRCTTGKDVFQNYDPLVRAGATLGSQMAAAAQRQSEIGAQLNPVSPQHAGSKLSSDMNKSATGFAKTPAHLFNQSSKHHSAASNLNKSATAVGGGAIGVPTLKMLNPELFKEMEKAEKQTKDPIFLSVSNLRERQSYQELRMHRI